MTINQQYAKKYNLPLIDDIHDKNNELKKVDNPLWADKYSGSSNGSFDVGRIPDHFLEFNENGSTCYFNKHCNNGVKEITYTCSGHKKGSYNIIDEVRNLYDKIQRDHKDESIFNKYLQSALIEFP